MDLFENKLGFLFWYKQDERKLLEPAIADLKRMGVKKLRVNLSWAEWEYPQGRQLIDECFPRLAEEFEMLPCVNYTPPKLGESPATNSPPRDLEALARFIADEVIPAYGDLFNELEIWNEPNLNTDWDPEKDPDHSKFTRMFILASQAARSQGKKVVLGGMNKMDMDWMRQVCVQGILDHVDVFGIHGLRGTWSEKTLPPSWPDRVSTLKKEMASYTKKDIPVWVTEFGFPPVDLHKEMDPEFLEKVQVAVFAEMLDYLEKGEIDRAYWYTLYDMDPGIKSVRHVTTGWEDKLQHHFGIIGFNNRKNPKLLARLLMDGGTDGVRKFVKANNLDSLKYTVIKRGEPF